MMTIYRSIGIWSCTDTYPKPFLLIVDYVLRCSTPQFYFNVEWLPYSLLVEKCKGVKGVNFIVLGEVVYVDGSGSPLP